MLTGWATPKTSLGFILKMDATSVNKGNKKMYVEVERGDTFRSDITTSRSYIFGTVFKDEVVLIDKEFNIYTTSLKLNRTFRVCEQGKDIYSCAPLKDDRIVCGSIHGTILIYDQHWDLIKEIDLRRPSISSSNTAQYVCVDVDEDDMILAAIFDDTVVQVFSADSSEAIESLTADDLPIRDIRALSNGRVIARICKPNGTDLSFVNHSGTLVSPWSSFFYDKYIWSVSVDRSCDALYIIYWMINVRSTQFLLLHLLLV